MRGAIDSPAPMIERIDRDTARRWTRPIPTPADGQRDKVALSGWGRFPRSACRLFAPASENDLSSLLAAHPTLIARGNGRAYGDAALNPAATVAMRHFERILAFDEATGLVVCEAGALLSDIIAAVLPRGWFPPVIPGTKHVSVGGMVAADVHGKNHPHAGSFAHHVCWIEVMIGDGTVMRCSPMERLELFEATLGGMGLTGIVLRVAFALMRIESFLMVEQTIRCADLAATFAAFEANRDTPYAVAWLDCLSRDRPGRSLVQLGRHAPSGPQPLLEDRQARTLRVPPGFPGFLANRTVVAALSGLRFSWAREGTKLVPLDRFFFPLDAVADLNRLYGRRGLVQYQFALPGETALSGIDAILRRIAQAGQAPLLAVLKRFGPGRGMMSFPLPGYTLAIDFAATREAIELLATLDNGVIDAGGRVYLAKDAISAPAQIARSYPGLAAFRAVRERIDPRGRFSSLLSRRLEL